MITILLPTIRLFLSKLTNKCKLLPAENNGIKIPQETDSFGMQFELCITQTISIISLKFQGSQAKKPGFLFQKGLYPIISLTSLTVFAALSLAFSPPFLTTLARYLSSERMSFILLRIGSVNFMISSASCFFISP